MGEAEDKDSAYTEESGDAMDVSSSDCDRKSEHTHVEYCCEFCKMKFRKNAKYVRHLRTHTKEVFFDFGLDATRNRLLVIFPIVENRLAERTIWFVI